MNLFTELRRYRWYVKGRSGIKESIEGQLAAGGKIKIILGASSTSDEGWIATDIPHFNILKEKHWQYFFGNLPIDNLLAEHVLEHLSKEQVAAALSLAHSFLKPGGCFRIAVPDGYHPDPAYLAYISPPSHDHLSIWNIESLTKLVDSAGFRADPLEYYSREGEWKMKDFDFKNGIIFRSKGKGFVQEDYPGYSSLIVDCYKK